MVATSGRAPVAARPGAPPAHPLRAFLVTVTALGVIVAAMALPFVGAGALGARNAARTFESLPSGLQAPPPPARSVLLARDGSTIGEIAFENRVQVPLTEIDPTMRAAIIAVEDARFYQHGGVDLRGALRALARNSSAGEVEEGGSTLTQQYVKNVLIGDARTAKEREAARAKTLSRKLQEARYAISLESRLSKDEILERYLNIAYFGDGAYGIEAAATHYFDVRARDLTLAQSATLAGVVQSPERYNPAVNTSAAQVRRDVVLDRMSAEGLASSAEVAAAKRTRLAADLDVQPFKAGCTSSTAPYFCDYVLAEMKLNKAFGATPQDRATLLRRGGLTIQTTLDAKLQKSAQSIVDKAIPRKDPSNKATAVVTVEPGTGEIRVMTQNRTYGKGRGRTNINYSVDKRHNGTTGVQAGSTFKAFTLAAALDKGLPIQTYFSTSGRQTYTGFEDCDGVGFAPYPVSSGSAGSHSMATATAYSVNGYFVALERETGLCETAKMVDRLGVRQADGTKVPRYPSLTLGTAATTPLAMANAYAVFAAEGTYCRPVAISSIRDRDGKPLPVPSAACKQVIKPAVAQAVTTLLTGVIDGPYRGRTGSAMSLGRPAAGKTGTTEDNAAVWFVGYTPQLASAVWVGDPNGGSENPLRNVTINGRYYSELFGGTFAGPIWKQVMLKGLEGLDESTFSPPDPGGGVNGVRTRVPDLTNADSGDALRRLDEVGLRGEISQGAIPSALPAGTVLYTSPRSGSFLRSGDTVTLFVSSGVPPAPRPTPTPSVQTAPPTIAGRP